MIKRIVIPGLLVLFVLNCKQNKTPNAVEIVNKSIEVSGGDKITNSKIDFNFRDKHYSAIRNNGKFKLGRSFITENDTIVDWLSNTDFKRTINNDEIELVYNLIPKYSASVNSVHYFSVLPFGLNDPAVNKMYMDEVNVNEKKYHKIKITFNEEGGGEDFEDVFIYYVNIDTHKVDYLSYSYSEDHGVGLRFREAYNERYVNGIRFVDYKNYKPKDKNAVLENLEVAFENGKLELLSRIDLKEIEVSLLD